MSQDNTNHQKRLYAVGGLVVGASAVAAVMATYNVLLHDDNTIDSSALRGSSVIPIGTDTSLSKGIKNQKHSNITSSSEVYPVIAQNNVTSLTSHYANDQHSNDMAELILAIEDAARDSYSAPDPSPSSATANVSMYPTYSPTLEGVFPTFMPTALNVFSPKALPIKRSNENGFRLKMYWEEGYYWQENTSERWWCMACQSGNCVSNSKIELRNCKVKSDLDAIFVANPFGANGHQFRVANTNLCLQKMGRGRAIKLKKCMKPKKKHVHLQLFKGFKPGEKFDLRPSSYLDRCLSQHHHPKANEIVYAESCSKAHRPDTGYWVTY